MNRWYIIGLVLIIVILISPLAVVEINYGDQVEIVSYKFVEEYLKFLGSLISITFGFYLINVLWAKKESGEVINQTKKVLLNYLLQINKAALKILDLLDKPFDEVEYDKSQQRDAEVVHLVEKIQKIGMTIENAPVDIRSLKDDDVRKVYTEFIWGDLLPILDKLFSTKDFRNNYDEFLSIIAEITMLINDNLNELH
jgi:hypothetical protein